MNEEVSIKNQKTSKTDKRVEKRRVPLHKQKRIGIAEDPNCHIRLVNDVDDRLEAFKKAGYTHVKGLAKEGDRDAQDASQPGSVASQQVGNGITAYYMKTTKENYAQDQRNKQKKNDRTMDQIYKGGAVPIGRMVGSIDVETKPLASNSDKDEL